MCVSEDASKTQAYSVFLIFLFLCRYKSSLSHLAEIRSRLQRRCVFTPAESFQTRRRSTKEAFVNVRRFCLRASRLIQPGAHTNGRLNRSLDPRSRDRARRRGRILEEQPDRYRNQPQIDRTK